jgi:glucokinase
MVEPLLRETGLSEKLIGVDVGGTSARAAEFDSAGSDRIERQERFPVGDYATGIRTLISTIRELASDASVSGIGFAVAGELDHENGTLRKSPNAPDWAGKPLKQDLEKAFDCPVRLINDAQAAALAEATFGRHQEDFWFIIWGTGIGGSSVSFRQGSPSIIDAEPGHQIVNAGDAEVVCGAGHQGCLEAYASGDGIQRRYGKPAADLSEAEWTEVGGWLARGLHNIIRAHPTELIVIGGGVGVKQAKRLPAVEKQVNEQLDGFRTVKLQTATHGEDAGLIGALALLKNP